MKECVICKQKVGLFSKRTADGYLCSKCGTYIPIGTSLRYADSDYLNELYQKCKEKANLFDCTASYGNLYIDSTHSSFCISNTSMNGNPRELGNIFFITELLEVALYCSDVRNVGTKKNKVVCDVKMKVTTKDITAEYVIQKNETCSYTSRGNKLEWFEPDRLIMFRNMFNQMIDNVRFNLLKKLNDIQTLQQGIKEASVSKDVQWAKGVLFLDNADCTKEEIKRQRNVLMKMFHPDRHPELSETYAEKINKAYDILIKK